MRDAATEAREAIAQVMAAGTCEELFGARGDGAATRATNRLARKLKTLLHPDRAASLGVDPGLSQAAFIRLEELLRAWLQEPSKATQSVTVRGSHGSYVVGKVVATGSVATLYDLGDSLVAKIARSSASNSHLASEREALGLLGGLVAKQDWLAPYYPRLVDNAVLRTASGLHEVNVLERTGAGEGYLNLAQILRAFSRGLDGRDWAWMMRRLLWAVAGAHKVGLVHGAITAENVLIHPEQHGVVLAGWSAAVREGETLSLRLASAKDNYPPEAAGPVTAATDVWMLAQLMLQALAPGERAQRAFARGCRLDAPRMRPEASDLAGEYDRLLERLYGVRTYRPFSVPNFGPETTAAPAARKAAPAAR